MGSLFYHALLERINLFSIQAVSCIQNATFFRLPVVTANPCRPIIPGAVAGRMATTKYASCFSQHVRRSWAEPNNQGRPHDINIPVTWSPGASFLCCLISHNTSRLLIKRLGSQVTRTSPDAAKIVPGSKNQLLTLHPAPSHRNWRRKEILPWYICL